MNHITTYTGEDFNPLRLDVERIKIEDIAHALSMICRANGHFERFFSVAQHAINCATEALALGYSGNRTRTPIHLNGDGILLTLAVAEANFKMFKTEFISGHNFDRLAYPK